MGEDTNGDGDVSEDFAHDFTVTELKTEVISSGGGISSPRSSSDETIPSVLDGFTKLIWEHSGVSFLNDGKSQKGDVDELRGKSKTELEELKDKSKFEQE